MNPKGPRRGFIPIGSVVNSVMRGMSPSRDDGLERVRELWRRVVGVQLAGLSRVRGVKKGTVIVEVNSAVARAEIEPFWRAPFLHAIAEEGIGDVRKVTFTLANET